MKTKILILIAAAAALATGSLPATLVQFPLAQMFGGGAYNKSFRVDAVRPLLTDNTNMFVGSYTNVTPSGGTNPIVVLTPNDYLVTFQDARTPWRISVPNSATVLNALALTSGPLPTFTYTPSVSLFLTNSDTRPIHFDDVLNVGNSTNWAYPGNVGVQFSVASIQLFNTNASYAFGYPYLTGYTNDGLGIQSGWDGSSDGNIFGFAPPHDTNYSGWNGVSVGRGYKVIKSRIVGSSFRNGVASYGTPFLKFEQNVFAPGYPSFVASYTPFAFYQDIQLEGSNIWVSTGYAGGPSQGVQFVFTDYATYTNYFPIGEDGEIPITAIRGSANILTNVTPLTIVATNSPQNGWALRYTTNGGKFYWAP